MTDPAFIKKLLETCNTRSPEEILQDNTKDAWIGDGYGDLENKTSDIISGAISFCLEASAESLGDLLLMARRRASWGTHALTNTDGWAMSLLETHGDHILTGFIQHEREPGALCLRVAFEPQINASGMQKLKDINRSKADKIRKMSDIERKRSREIEFLKRITDQDPEISAVFDDPANFRAPKSGDKIREITVTALDMSHYRENDGSQKFIGIRAPWGRKTNDYGAKDQADGALVLLDQDSRDRSLCRHALIFHHPLNYQWQHAKNIVDNANEVLPVINSRIRGFNMPINAAEIISGFISRQALDLQVKKAARNLSHSPWKVYGATLSNLPAIEFGLATLSKHDGIMTPRCASSLRDLASQAMRHEVTLGLPDLLNLLEEQKINGGLCDSVTITGTQSDCIVEFIKSESDPETYVEIRFKDCITAWDEDDQQELITSNIASFILLEGNKVGPRIFTKGETPFCDDTSRTLLCEVLNVAKDTVRPIDPDRGCEKLEIS